MQQIKQNKVYNLEERTSAFGESVIDFAKLIPKGVVTLPLISLFVRSGTSVGANYMEADCAESRKDFEHKIGICKKEAKETRYWIRMIRRAVPELSVATTALWQEANELQLIFVTIVKNSKANSTSALDIRN